MSLQASSPFLFLLVLRDLAYVSCVSFLCFLFFSFCFSLFCSLVCDIVSLRIDISASGLRRFIRHCFYHLRALLASMHVFACPLRRDFPFLFLPFILFSILFRFLRCLMRAFLDGVAVFKIDVFLGRDHSFFLHPFLFFWFFSFLFLLFSFYISM